MATIRKRENRKGVTWQIDYYDPHGKRKMKSFKRKKDAEAYLAKVGVAKREGKYDEIFKPPKETLFNELADHYVEFYQGQRSFAGFKSHVIRELREVFGERKLSQITYLDLEKWRHQRKATPTKAGRPRADASVNADMAILGHMLNKAIEWEMLETSPFKKGKRLMFKLDNQRTKFLNEEEINALLAACIPHLRPIVETALLTGMRRGELLGLKWEQIRHGHIYLTKTKSGKGRQIPINIRLAEVFKYLRLANQLKSEFVFCDSQGRRFYEVKRSFTAACKRAELYDFRFHDLRHTFASRLVMKGVSLKAVQELLGHADLKMTMRYAHLSKSHLKEAVNLLDTLSTGKEMVKNLSFNSRKAGRDERI
jgi:integrase